MNEAKSIQELGFLLIWLWTGSMFIFIAAIVRIVNAIKDKKETP